jgi:hypothetical protein
MRSQRPQVTNPDRYVSTVVFFIMAASVAAMVFGFVVGRGF